MLQIVQCPYGFNGRVLVDAKPGPRPRITIAQTAEFKDDVQRGMYGNDRVDSRSCSQARVICFFESASVKDGVPCKNSLLHFFDDDELGIALKLDLYKYICINVLSENMHTNFCLIILMLTTHIYSELFPSILISLRRTWQAVTRPYISALWWITLNRWLLWYIPFCFSTPWVLRNNSNLFTLSSLPNSYDTFFLSPYKAFKFYASNPGKTSCTTM